ncbi:NADH:flavin oxidoreductase [Candidatus Thorarchaeota archaeon]|nr:MAG: NADH:flavin oxidoreductase [Candidatus Thorarchaeota archaeon]
MPELSDPIRIAGLQIRNRTAMAPMVRNLADEEGKVTKEAIDHYRLRAMGGVGLIIVEAAAIDWNHRIMNHNIGIHNDAMIQGLSELAAAIKDQGSSAFIQINHSGPKGHGKQTYVGPSSIPIMKNNIPVSLTGEDIQNIKHLFVDAARRAKEAGFDGVEIHGAHYYLLSAFLSSYTNQRRDEYGGSVVNRARFSVEVIKAIREELGDYPLIFRLNGLENVVGGVTLEEGIEIAKLIEGAGINALHISCVVDETYNPGLSPRFDRDTQPDFLRGYPYDSCIPIAGKIKQHVKIPVIGVGMVRDAQTARDVMKKDQCDILALGRALLADPEFVNKTFQGKDNEIIPWKD